MSVAAGNPTQAATTNPTAASATASSHEDDDYGQDQVKVFSHEGDGENTEHLNSMDLHDIKTELERDAEKAETPKSVTNSASSPTFNADGSSVNATSLPVLPQASIRPVLHPPTAMVYANGSAVPFMIPPFAAAAAAAAAGGSSLYPVMRPVKVESDWKLAQGNGTQLNIPTYSYPAGFLPMDQSGLRPAYPFMTIPGQYVTTPMSYPTQFATLGGSVAPNAVVQPNSGGMLTQHVKEKKPHIKKPLNAFMLFMKQKRADVIKECTLKESAAINQILGKMWHALDRSEQAKYYELAREERAKHMQMYPGWSARDNYAVHKKRRKRKLKQPDSKADAPDDRMGQDKELCNAAVSIPANLATPTSTSAPAQSQHHMLPPPATTSPSGTQRPEEEEIDLNNRKCRARFGLDQQNMWCGPCRRKKKCIRYSVGDDDGAVCKEVGVCETGEAEEEDIVLGGGDVLATTSTASSLLLSEETSDHHHHSTLTDKLPRLLSHEVPVTLQTIPT